MKIDEVNRQLKRFGGDHNWKKRKEIIKKAVEQRNVHPDNITCDGLIPLAECVMHNYKSDVGFAQLLLKRGANARAFVEPTRFPLIYFAQTTAMASLLVQHGAQDQIKRYGSEILCNLLKIQDLSLIPFYIAHGVNPNNPSHDGEIPLQNIVLNAMTDDLAVQKGRILLQNGALLSVKNKQKYIWFAGYSAPQLLKARLHDSEEDKKSYENTFVQKDHKTLKELRKLFIAAQEYRNIRFCIPLMPFFPKELCGVVGSYGVPEKSYEELEEEPCPQNLSD